MFRRSIAGAFALFLYSAPLFAQTLPAPMGLPHDVASVQTTSSATRTGVMPSFASLFSDIGNDFKRLPSKETALILGLAGAASLGVHGQDQRITQSVSGSQTADTMFESGAVIGSGLVQVGAAFATFALGHAFDSPRVASLGADLVRAQILTTAMTQGLKIAVGRTRPNGAKYSFPSGHSSSSFATAAVLQRHFGWKVGAPAYGAAAWIAGSRLQGNKHYLSDVMFGAGIGIVAGRTVTVGHGNTRFALSPIPSPGGGGGGVGVTWISPR